MAKLIAKLLCAGLRVPVLLSKVLIVANVCSIGLHILNGTAINLLRGGALFSYDFLADLPRGFPSIFINATFSIVIVVLVTLFLGARLKRTLVTANSGRGVTLSRNVGAGNVGVLNLVVSGNLVKLYNNVVSRGGNCTSIGVNVKAVIVNLTTVVVNRITFKGLDLAIHLITIIVKDVLCHFILLVILGLKFNAGSFGLVSTLILTVYLSLPLFRGGFGADVVLGGKIRHP